MITHNDRQKVANAVVSSRINGITLADAMDASGALLTDERIEIMERQVFTMLRVAMEAETPESVVRWHFGETRPVTGREMFYALMAWLDDTVNNIMANRAAVMASKDEVSP